MVHLFNPSPAPPHGQEIKQNEPSTPFVINRLFLLVRFSAHMVVLIDYVILKPFPPHPPFEIYITATLSVHKTVHK